MNPNEDSLSPVALFAINLGLMLVGFVLMADLLAMIVLGYP